MQDYRKIVAWQKAHRVSMDIVRATQRFRRGDLGSLRRQLQSAAESVPANIVEGSSKSSNREFARFLDISLASAAETQYHLQCAVELGLLSRKAHGDFADRVEEVRRMVYSLMRRVRDSDS